jgi:hypothetical protein
MTIARFVTLAGVATALALGSAGAAHAQNGVNEKVAALRAHIAASKTALLKYQWVQTTTVSLNGEVKSTKVQSVRFGPDGQQVKTDLSAPPPPPPGGLRGRIIEHKKEELTDYMQKAVELVKAYVPPTGALIEAAKAAGGISLALAPNGAGAIINIANYLKPGDKLSVTVEPGSEQITDLAVNTYMADTSDPVTLNVEMGVLPGNISYAANIVLTAPAKGITVNIQNSNYSRITN